MDSKLITQVALVVAIVLLVGWDIYADVNQATGDTISEVTLAILKAVPLIALILGVVVGHLVTSFDTPGQPISAWGALVQYVKIRPVFPFVWGMVGGALFWYQSANFEK